MMPLSGVTAIVVLSKKAFYLTTFSGRVPVSWKRRHAFFGEDDCNGETLPLPLPIFLTKPTKTKKFPKIEISS
jgi:hypothetical protein